MAATADRSDLPAALDPAQVPAPVRQVLEGLQGAGFAAFLVGGCVRDLLLGRTPQDWDVATAARPEQVQALFPRTAATGLAYGTVTVLTPEPVEVTTFRRDLAYLDGRRPAAVVFGQTVEEDLARRDFTVNAIAWDPGHGSWVDPFGGRADLAAGVLRAVGEPEARFREDALRMLRAVRLAVQLEFTIEPATWRAIERCAPLVRRLSWERIRDECLKLLAAPAAATGLWMLHELGLLFLILPELQPAAGLPQGKPGAPTLLAHLIATVEACPPDPLLRLAALLHDVGKPATRGVQPDGRVTFHGHEVVGAELADDILRRLRLDARSREHVVELIRLHMVSGDEVGKKALRRWLGRYGERWVRDLLRLRRADHVASGHPGPNPWADRLERELEEVLAEQGALRVSDLAVDGHDVMRVLGVPPGPVVGRVLQALLERVLEEPQLNQREKLLALLESWRAGDGVSWGN